MTDTTKTNLRRSRTGQRDHTGDWYTLDNAAIIMPAVANRVTSSLFRISTTLHDIVSYAAAAEALKRVSVRFPYFLVELRRGIFWYYFQPLGRTPEPVADSRYPNVNFDIKQRGQFMFRVRLRERTIACEFSHILADGTGALRFLETLLSEYFRILGHDIPDGICGVRLAEQPSPEEYEDAYERFFKNNYPHPERRPRAFHQIARPLGPMRYRVTTGEVDAAELKEIARGFGASITELCVALVFDSLQTIRASYPLQKRKRTQPIAAVEVPVNMRRFYPSKTLRNFTLFALPSIDLRLGPYAFEELVAIAHHRMAIEASEREMAKHISRNAGGVRNLLVRLTPLFAKDLAAKALFDAFGEGLISNFISNLGTIALPDPFQNLIDRLDFVGAASRTTQTNIAMASWNGRTRISFGSLVESRELERLFFSRLAALGIRVRVECNMEEFS